MIGGLGGFVLPIAFGALNDLTGIWTSCFMLLFLIAGGSLVWMHLAIQRMERGALAAGLRKLPEFPEMEPIHEEKHVGALSGARAGRMEAGGRGSSGTSKGRAIARRNLWISIPALLLAFVIWMVWSVVVAKLPAVGFKFTTDQLFWLAAMPGLSGATLRIFYSFMPPIFGGRLWTSVSTWSLMVPAVGIGLAVQSPDTPYIFFLSLALLCGLGGGNFASSMANISFFFPKAEKGNALALNAGLGNLGVSVGQFVIPLVITTGVFGWFGGDPQVAAAGASKLWLQNAGFIWVPFIAISAFAAWFGMHDIADMRASFADQAVIFKRKHNWLMCWLYTGTFGSFIGYSAGFPLLGQDHVPAGRLAEVHLPRAAGRRAVALGDRLAVGSLRRRPRHLLGVRADDRGGRRRSLLPRHQGSGGSVLGLLRHVHDPVLRDRRRQRVHLPDDPGDHARRKFRGSNPASARRRGRSRPKWNWRRSSASPRRSRPMAPSSSRKPTARRSRSPAGRARRCGGSWRSTSPASRSPGSSTPARGGLLRDIERGGSLPPVAAQPAE